MVYSNLPNPRIFKADKTISTPDAEVELRSGCITRLEQDMQIANALRGRPSDGMSIVGAGDEDPDDMREYPGGEISDFILGMNIWMTVGAVLAGAALLLAALWLCVHS